VGTRSLDRGSYTDGSPAGTTFLSTFEDVRGRTPDVEKEIIFIIYNQYRLFRDAVGMKEGTWYITHFAYPPQFFQCWQESKCRI
jgi:hypothetical protein